MRRCPRCGEEVEDRTIHYCQPPVPDGVFIKFNVLKILDWFKKRKERKWKT